LCCRGVFHGEYDRKGGDSFSNHIDGFTSSLRDGHMAEIKLEEF
jgi:hypothetical protein